MRRTQQVTSYVSMFVILVTGVVFMVGLLVHDGFNQFVHGFLHAALEMNLAFIGGIGAVGVILILLLIWRYQAVV